uniref:Uncharacterized protein n=1 Tax=Monopterus albus TaxID=43700 RepID=A0A3Q3JDL9_MONAL
MTTKPPSTSFSVGDFFESLRSPKKLHMIILCKKKKLQVRPTVKYNFKHEVYLNYLKTYHFIYNLGLRGSIELSRIRCVEIVKNRGGFIPCQNKYPFQVSWTLKVLHSPVGETAPSCILLTCSAF